MEERTPSLKDLVTILYRPRETFRRIRATSHGRWTIELVVLSFVCASVGDADIRGLDQMFPGLSLDATLSMVALGLLCMAGIWVVLLYAVAGIATLVGRRMEGKATAADVRAALAWGLVPIVWSVVFRVPFVIYRYRFDLQSGDRQMLFDFIQRGGLTVVIVFATMQVLLYVWVAFVASNTLGEAFGFSSWRGLATLALSISLPFILIIGVVISFAS